MYSRLVLTGLALFASASCAAPIPAVFQLSFDDASARAAAGHDGAYEADSLEALNGALHEAALQCTASRRSESFSYVLGIGEDGGIVEVYTSSASAFTRCFKRVLRRQQLPPPRQAPYFKRGSYSLSRT